MAFLNSVSHTPALSISASFMARIGAYGCVCIDRLNGGLDIFDSPPARGIRRCYYYEERRNNVIDFTSDGWLVNGWAFALYPFDLDETNRVKCTRTF